MGLDSLEFPIATTEISKTDIMLVAGTLHQSLIIHAIAITVKFQSHFQFRFCFRFCVFVHFLLFHLPPFLTVSLLQNLGATPTKVA